MGWMNKLIVLLLAACTFTVQASINVSLHQDLELLVLNKKNVGFTIFDNNKFTLENGKQQIVIRVSKLVQKQGQKEKFKSEPIIITLDTNDAELIISPTRVFFLHERIEGFDKNPVLSATNNGKPFELNQVLLERGAGISRDYAAELKAQNEFNNVAITPASEVAVVTTTVKKAASPLKMSQDLFAKASATEKEQFTDWAFKNRKEIKSQLVAEGKILPMLEYWYEKATSDERAEILTWVLAQ